MTKKGERIAITFIIVCAIICTIIGCLFAREYVKEQDEIKEYVGKELNMANPELEYYDTEEVAWLDYICTYYFVKGTNYLVTVQHNEDGIHLIDIEEVISE